MSRPQGLIPFPGFHHQAGLAVEAQPYHPLPELGNTNFTSSAAHFRRPRITLPQGAEVVRFRFASGLPSPAESFGQEAKPQAAGWAL